MTTYFHLQNLYFNSGYSLDDLWSRLSDELCNGSFQSCNMTFQVKHSLLSSNFSVYSNIFSINYIL